MEIENLIRLIETVSASSLTGLKYEENGVKLHLSKKKDQVQIVSATGMNEGMDSARASIAAAAGVAGYEGAGMSGREDTAYSISGGAQSEGQATGKIVESPLVGRFYAAPSEDAAPFVSVGDTVKKGQTLAIIEAMKLMNEIESEYDGIIEEILVGNGQAVEYGQPLFRIR